MAVEDPTKKQIEEVDPEVAKILGLKDNFDLEQDEYKTLLREKMTELDMKSSQASSRGEDTKKLSDAQSLLIEEFKRIKNLKGSTFTASKKAVNVDSFFNKKPKDQEAAQKPITDPAKLLPGSGGALTKYQPPDEQEQEQKKDDGSEKIKDIEKFLNKTLLDIVKEIRGLTEDILSILQKQSSVDKKGSELSRREGEKKKDREKEKDLEGKKEEKKGLGLVNKILKPFTSVFDTIKNFITMVLLGSLVNWLFSVLQNPMILLKPIQGLIDGITGFFNSIIQFIDKMVVQPVRTFIDAINTALNGFIGLLNSALKMLPGSPQIGPANIPNIPKAPEIQAPNITGESKTPEDKPASGPPVNLQFTGGEVRPPKVITKTTGGSIEKEKVIAKTTSGAIEYTGEEKKKLSFDDQVSREGGNVNSKTTSFDVSGLGPDKHLTALSTGEYVLKKGAADWLGGPVYLDKVNKIFGGTTERRTANLGDIKIQTSATGGEIGGSSKSSGSGSSSGSSSNSSSTSFNVGGRVFSPTQYSKNVTSSRYIEVGKNPPKSYTLGFVRDSPSGGKYTIKMVNKLVSGAGLGKLVGQSDNLTGVLPSSPEGQSILKSSNVADYFRTVVGTAKMFNLELKYDKDADIQYWYNQAYQTHYNDWKKQGISDKQAKQMAASAAAEFAISKMKGSWLPGSKKGAAPEYLKNQAVETDNLSASGPGGPGGNTSSDSLTFSESDLTKGTIYGDPSYESKSTSTSSGSSKPSGSSSAGSKISSGEKQQYTSSTSSTSQENNKPSSSTSGSSSPSKITPAQSQPSTPLIPSGQASEQELNKMTIPQLAKMLDPTQTGRSNPIVFEESQRARSEGQAQGLTGEALEKKVLIASILAKQGSSTKTSIPSTTAANIAAATPGKPLNIPQPPQNQPNVTMMPLPSIGKGGQPQVTGMSKTGTTPVVYFASYDSSESSIITTASIYNIWGM